MRGVLPPVLMLCFGITVAVSTAAHPGKEPELARLNGSAALTTGAVATNAGAQREPNAPKELIERVGAWAEVFLMHGPEYTAIETREETRTGKKGGKRVTVAEYTVRREAGGRISEERKLVSVDGQEARNDKTLEVSGLHNPFVIVSQLAERNRERMKFVFAQDTSDVDATGDYILLGYRQVDGEGLAELDGKPVYPRGEAWVDPNDGRIWRIEDEVATKDKRYTTVVEFSKENELNTWLPQQIIIRVFSKGHMERQVVVTYSGFREASNTLTSKP